MLVRVSLTACAQVRRDASRSSSFLLKQLIANNHGQHRRLSSFANSNQSNLFQALATHDPRSIAVKHHKSGRKFTYADLNRDILEAQKQLIQKCSAKDMSSLKGERVAFVATNDYYSVGTVPLF
jgi:predicted flavoprotein YhiN